ncbi:MAG: A24 family peptidase [Chloroflexota bacterium]
MLNYVTFYSTTVAFGCMLLAIGLAIAIVDFISLRIPDVLNCLLAATGFAWQIMNGSSSLLLQIFYSIGLLIFFYLIRVWHFASAEKQGLGLGDVKMAGAAGLWISPLNFPVFVFLSSSTGLLFALIKLGRAKSTKIPFGPFLALGLFLTWIWENYGGG